MQAKQTCLGPSVLLEEEVRSTTHCVSKTGFTELLGHHSLHQLVLHPFCVFLQSHNNIFMSEQHFAHRLFSSALMFCMHFWVYCHLTLWFLFCSHIVKIFFLVFILLLLGRWKNQTVSQIPCVKKKKSDPCSFGANMKDPYVRSVKFLVYHLKIAFNTRAS